MKNMKLFEKDGKQVLVRIVDSEDGEKYAVEAITYHMLSEGFTELKSIAEADTLDDAEALFDVTFTEEECFSILEAHEESFNGIVEALEALDECDCDHDEDEECDCCGCCNELTEDDIIAIADEEDEDEDEVLEAIEDIIDEAEDALDLEEDDD